MGVIVQVQVVAEALRGGATLGASVSTDCTIFTRDHLTPFFAYPARRSQGVYTTNAVESLNMSLRKGVKDARLVSHR